MSASSASKKGRVVVSTVGMYEDIDRQLSGLTIKPRKTRGKQGDNSVPLAAYLEKGSIEGPYPAVKVSDASLGMVGKAIESRRGLDVFEYTAGTEKIVTVKLALGLDQKTNASLRALLRGVVDKIEEFRNPMTKSMWYQNQFGALDDGTKVFRATQALQAPEGFCDVVLDDGFVWESPSSTWGPFLYGDDADTRWYVKARVNEDATVYLYSNKKGFTEFSKTSEAGQVVYPKGGIPVKNTNMLKTLLSSKMYSEKMWKAKCVMKLTSINLKCAPAGLSKDGVQQYAVYPVFNFSIPSTVILVEYDPSVNDEGGLTDKQREDATRAILFEGMVAPKIKRKAREPTTAPVFNKKRKVQGEEVDVEEEDEELDTDGED